MPDMTPVTAMIAMLEAPEPVISKVADAPASPAITPAPPAAPAPASPGRVEAAVHKIASAEDVQLKEAAASFGVEFAKSASKYFEDNKVFEKNASAPADKAALEGAFRDGFDRGAAAAVERFNTGYALQLKVAHDVATNAHYSGQQHCAEILKSASAVDDKGVAKSASDVLGDVLPFHMLPAKAG